MNDLISRQAAIDALKEHRALYCDNTPDAFSKLSHAEKSRVDELDTAIATLVNLPSANKSGHWVMNPSEVAGDGYYICSNCNNDVYDATDFCPNCGADMRGEQDG